MCYTCVFIYYNAMQNRNSSNFNYHFSADKAHVLFTPDSKDDVGMQRPLRTFYSCSSTILHQFAKYDESVKLVLFSSFCSCYYCPYLWLHMTKHSARILRVAYYKSAPETRVTWLQERECGYISMAYYT